ncbi:MAG: MBL fold metallo-hydrolase [Acetobacteraceae bacterium]|nr:MBL fold metallo-hydrolase [Acetobacteraceae bacterium]
MHAFICTTCGTQLAPSEQPPDVCPICSEERQYVNPQGQSWTTLDALRRSHFTTSREEEPGLIGLGTSPKFGIGQRALLLSTPAGNVLWDCVSLLDPATVAMIRGIGGLAGVAISHPHYYTTMVEWAHAFGCPVHLHAADRQWVMRDDRALRFWEGDETALLPGVTLVRLGGHYAGGTVLHWREGAGGKGALLSGDIAQVTPDKMVSFMWSYPDLLPLPVPVVRQIAERAAGYAFDRIYGAFWESVVPADGSAVVARSAARYVRLLETPGQP